MFPEWQLISTAPKDGTKILTFQTNETPGGTMRVTFWRDDTVPKGWPRVSWLRLTGCPCLDAPASSAQRREPDRAPSGG
jgi:hypothetical protein